MKVSKILSTEAVVEMIHNTCRKVGCLSLKECNRYVTYLSQKLVGKVSLSFHLSVVNPNTRLVFFVCQIGFMPLLIGTPDKKVFFKESLSVHYSLNSHLHTHTNVICYTFWQSHFPQDKKTPKKYQTNQNHTKYYSICFHIRTCHIIKEILC